MNMLPAPAVILVLIILSLSGCYRTQGDEPTEQEERKVVVTNPIAQDVQITQMYVCQIHSRRHIQVRALMEGYLEEIRIREGQLVRKGDVLYQILPSVYQADLDAKSAEAQVAKVKLEQSRKLLKDGVVSQVDVALHEAELAKAEAEAKRAQVDLMFTTIKAPFDALVDRLREREGSLIEEGTLLTTLSDNDVMWVYFNVPEAQYLEYMATEAGKEDTHEISLVLASGAKFPQRGKIAAIEGDFNNETGTVAFRADFPNPEHLLRNGQTGNVLIQEMLKDVMVIPQRATFEVLEKQFVFVVDDEGKLHQREIVVQHELEDIFVIASGLEKNDKIVLDGVSLVRDGEEVEYESKDPKEVLADLKYHAE